MRVRVAVLGASGYTGAELVRLLLAHPHVEIVGLTGDSQAGKTISEIYPHLWRHQELPPLIATEAAEFSDVDLVFSCLPHGVAQPVIAGIPKSVRVIDLSADFRLRDPNAYAAWYGHSHRAPALQQEAVYGLTEHARADIRRARLVAGPGCYPTSALLPLLPLIAARAILLGGIVIDAKSGLTGAGRVAQQSNLFCEINEGVSAYGIASHRHSPEIEQELSRAAAGEIRVSFTPHLIPMNRGILSTIYVSLAPGISPSSAKQILIDAYRDEPFVHILPGDARPTTHAVRGTNHSLMNLFADRVPGRAILVSVIDNLMKGASGQAVQNMNVMFGFDEAEGLSQLPLVP